MQIFAEVQYLCKRLWIAIISNRDLWDIIAIVIALNTLYKDFETMTVSFLETGNKIINKIQNILLFKEAKNISKYINKRISKLTMTFIDNNKGKRPTTKPAIIAINQDILEEIIITD